MVESKNRLSLSLTNSLSVSFQRAAEKEKQATLLKFQKENYQEWRKAELKYIGKFLMIHNFIEHPLDRWYYASFDVQGDYDVSCEISSEWKKFNEEKVSIKGYNISGKIIQPKCSIHLKSLACDIKVKVKLYGDCSLFFVSRNFGEIEVGSPVVKITRDTSLKGLYAMFGEVEQSTKKYVYNKQVQIPEDYSLQPLEKNYKEFKNNILTNLQNQLYFVSQEKKRLIQAFRHSFENWKKEFKIIANLINNKINVDA